MTVEIDRLKGKQRKLSKEISVKPKNRTDGSRSKNGTEQVILKNVKSQK